MTAAIGMFPPPDVEIQAVLDHDEDLKAQVVAVQCELAEVGDILEGKAGTRDTLPDSPPPRDAVYRRYLRSAGHADCRLIVVRRGWETPFGRSGTRQGCRPLRATGSKKR